MASPSLIAASRACFALSASFFSYQTVPNPETRQRVGNEAGRIGGSDVLLLERAISGRRFRAWAAGVSLLALLLCLGAQAFSQTCSTSCTGLCLQQTTCGGSGTTSVSGTVYAPNGTTPLPNVLVYVPNGGPTPSYGVTAFPAGVSCGVTASGCPMVSAVTATNGTFTLTNMPVGTDIPLVIQAGKWRRKISIPNVTACANTVLTAAQTSLPTVEGQGDVADNIPYIAVVTGEVDAAECVLLKMGVAQSQFTNPSGGGRINFYLGAADGGGEEIDASTPGEAALFASQASVDAYDLLMFPCQGSPTDAVAESSTNLAYLGNYANAGGHIYATHYSYQWLYTNPAFANTVNWSVGQTPPSPDPQTGYVNTSYPQGAQLAQWLKDVGASTVLGQIPLSTLRKDQNGVLGSTLSVLTIDYPSAADPTVMQLTFNTPLTAAPANQCGQVLYNEYHVFEEGDDHGDVFPAACTTGPLSPQEQLLAFSLFGLSTVVSAEPSPTVAVSITNSPAEFVQGDPADTFTINVSNTSTTSPTNPSLTLTAVLPAGLTVANMVGSTPTSGWTCNTGTLTCTRTTGLSASTSDAITLTVSVAGNLAAGSLETVSATASGGGIASSATGQDKVLIAGQTAIAVTNVNPASEDYGNTAPVTITAVLTWAGSGPAPTGTVSIGGSGFSGIFGATTCGSASGNTITCASTYTPSGTDLPGSYTVAASFTGDSNYTGSNSPQTGNFTIAPATTTTTVTSGTNPSVFGQSVILTASIAGEFGMARQGSPALAGERLTKGRLAKGARTKGAIARGELTKGESSRSGAIAGMQLDVSGSVTWSANTGCGTTPATSGNPAIATCTTSSLLVGDDAITATYLGDSDHGGSSGTLSNQVVSPASAAATASSSLNPSTYGQAVSFGVSVAAVAPGAGTPTGTVQFAVDGTNLGSAVTLVGGSASSGSIATLAEGTHSVTATYTGDGNFQGTVGTLSGGQVVGQATDTTVVTSNQNPSVFGQSVTLTATISGQFNYAKSGKTHLRPDVSGTVAWSANTGCSSSLVTPGNPGTATCVTTVLPVGTDAITATYSGDSNHGGSSGTLSNQVVSPASAAATVSSSLNPSTYGQAVSFGVSVAAVAPGAGTPTGTVQFAVDGTNFGSAVTLSSGTATSGSINTLAEGTHTVTATYSGSGNFQGTVGTLSGGQVVGQATDTTVVTSNQNPSVFGQSVTLTATISGQFGLAKVGKTRIQKIVTGTVTWSANTGCGSTAVTPGNPGTATCVTTILPVGTDAITATYSGDSNHGGSSGTLSNQVVSPASAAATVSSSLNPSTYGQAVSFGVSVAAVAPGAGMPTGTVQFAVDGTNFGSAVTLSSGTATSGSINTLAEGTHTVTATYSGSGNFQGTVGTLSGGQVVGQATDTTVVTSNQNPSVFGQSVTLTATISGQFGLAKVGKTRIQKIVTGTVTWSANTGCGSTAVTPGNPGTATCVTTILPVGTDAITATYSGDSNHGGSSGTLSGGQVVHQASTTTTLSSSVNPSNSGQSVSFTAKVAAVAPGTGTPTGTVQFAIDGTNFGSAVTLSGGSATSSSTSTLAPGKHSITAVYSGSASFASSSATALTQVVNLAPTITSASSVTFTLGVASSFTVTTTGYPTPSLVEAGALPAGVTFTNNGNGTGTLSGTPTAGGTFKITFTAANGVGSNAVQNFTLTASGPLVILTPTYNFGTVYLFSNGSTTITVKNSGTSTLNISGVTLKLGNGTNLGDFTFVSFCPPQLGAGQSCSINVLFFAGNIGSVSATLSVSDNSPGSPQQTVLSANVINPVPVLNPSNLNFGTLKVGSHSSAQTVTLTNVGTTALNITSIGVTGTNASDFAETNACPSSLAPGAKCTISVTFTPSAKGGRSANLTVIDNAFIGTQNVSLCGSGD